ncbi:hypothetical protein AS4_13840 [Acinetobacter guillouiae]|nr:hypothetical protein AS4_13840 [Acinetobacter guillouiae]
MIFKWFPFTSFLRKFLEDNHLALVNGVLATLTQYINHAKVCK